MTHVSQKHPHHEPQKHAGTGKLDKAAEAKHPNAPETPKELKADFKKADKNHDGKLSGDELKTKAGHEMHDIDGNHDFNFAEGLKSMSFKGRDINHDGKLSGSELNGLDQKDFKVGADGTLDSKAYLAGAGAEAKAHHEAEQKQAFGKADINHDGKLSGSELKGLKNAASFEKDGQLDLAGYQSEQKAERHDAWEARSQANFTKADINHDGKLSGSELKGLKDAAKYEKNGELDLDGYRQAGHDEHVAHRDDRLLNGPKDAPAKPEAHKPEHHKPAVHHHKVNGGDD